MANKNTKRARDLGYCSMKDWLSDDSLKLKFKPVYHKGRQSGANKIRKGKFPTQFPQNGKRYQRRYPSS